MSTTSKRSHGRKVAALGLAVIGAAGLSLASASQLNLTGSSSTAAQAGTTAVTAAVCQTSTIAITYGLTPDAAGTLATGADFGFAAESDALTLTAFDAACAGKNVKVALGTTTGNQIGTVYAGTVPDEGGAVTLRLNGADAAFGQALTGAQINTIAKVSVTVYGA